MTIFHREPAVLVGFVTAGLDLLVSLNLHGLSSGQAALIVGAITAVGGAVIAWRTRPVSPAMFTTAVSALAALAAGYGYHVRPSVVGAVSALLVAALALLTRAQVAPVGALPVAASTIRRAPGVDEG